MEVEKLCMCVSLPQNMFGVNFHTADKRSERKHKIIHTPDCKFRRRQSLCMNKILQLFLWGGNLLGNASFPIHTNCELNGKQLFTVYGHAFVLKQNFCFEIVQYIVKQTLNT